MFVKMYLFLCLTRVFECHRTNAIGNVLDYARCESVRNACDDNELVLKHVG